MYRTHGNVEGEQRQALEQLMNDLHAAVEAEAARRGIPKHKVPLLRPVTYVVGEDAERVTVSFANQAPGAQGGEGYFRDTTQLYADEAAAVALRDLFHMDSNLTLWLPRPGTPELPKILATMAAQLFDKADEMNVIEKLGDLTHVSQLEPAIREFLKDHPDYDRNVFVMMRFTETAQLDETWKAIQDCLTAHGMVGVRADSRDYTGDLWTNIEVHMAGCKYGVAVFEDFEQTRDFNPNIALELGYMMGRGKRALLLKEQRLPKMPSDVIGKLYKPFDQFKITETVTREVTRWVTVDLGLK